MKADQLAVQSPVSGKLALSNQNAWLFGFILLKFAVQYYVNGTSYELHRDEFLHLDQARHLQWGYFSVPPFSSWVSVLIAALGNGEFWIKFFPALFGALTIAVVWKTTEALGGKWYACALAALALIFSSLLRLNLLFQPNSPEILFCTLAYYTLLRYLQTKQVKWLYFAACALALGFLNKYNIVFCLAGLVPALLLSPHRAIFAQKHLYLALLLALILISPNLWWQYQNGFPVISHMRELRETQLENLGRAKFMEEQLMFFIGQWFIFIAGFVGVLVYGPLKRYRVFVLAYLFSLGLFILLKAKGYYSYGLYPFLLSFGAVYLEYLLSKGWKVYLRPLPVLIVLLLFLPMLRVAFPLQSPQAFYEDFKQKKPFSSHTWEDGREHPISQDFADMLGWKEMARKVDSLYAQLPDKEHVMVQCDNYGQAGAINYYSRFKNIGAITYNQNYLDWFPLDRKIKHLIMLKDGGGDVAEETPYFKRVWLAGKIENPYAREYGTRIYVLKDARLDLMPIIKRSIEEERIR